MPADPLLKLRALLSEASPRPWFNGGWSGRCHMAHAHGRGVCKYDYSKFDQETWIASSKENLQIVSCDDYGEVLSKADAKLICLAINSLPALLDLVDKADVFLKCFDLWERCMCEFTDKDDKGVAACHEYGDYLDESAEDYRLARAALGKTEGGTDGIP